MTEAKQKIREYVHAYRTMSPFKEEYQSFLTSNRPEIDARIENAKKDAYGFQKDVSDKLGRPLTEMPETLNSLLMSRLSAEEYQWFVTVPGKSWFATEFREFSAVKSMRGASK